MKTFLIISTFVLGVALAVSCEDNQTVTPIPGGVATKLSANFVLVNASPDAPSVDLYLNNLKVGASVANASAQPTYSNFPITTNSSANNGIQNTDIHVKATSGSIGGKLGSKDLIFRSGNNNTNNFQATDGAFYTLVVIDSINRPAPLRTNNSLGIGDITYYSTSSSFTTKEIVNNSVDTVIQLTRGYNNITTANLIKKYCKANNLYSTNNYLPPSFFPIGTVPLGSTDPGGVRFLLITDGLPSTNSQVVALPTASAGKATIRFINASPDAELGGVVTCTVNAVPLTSGLFSYPMFRVAAPASPTFDPAVGSRFAATSGTPPAPITASFAKDLVGTGSWNVVVSVAGSPVATLNGADFTSAGSYTVFLRGLAWNGTLSIFVMKNF